MIDNESLPVTDDVQDQGPTEQELLDAVMANSPIMEDAVPLPNEEVLEEDPTIPEDEVEDPESEEVVNEEDEEVESEDEEVEGEDDTSTQDTEAYSLDDLEEFDVIVKIDGEEQSVSIQDLVKGYSTEQSLSAKGRELGEARKALDEERAEKLAQIETISTATQQALLGPEQAMANRYHEIEQQIEKARSDGDTYEVNELKDKREQAQKQYWTLRNRREKLIQETTAAQQQAKEEEFNKQISNFQEHIGEVIPDFSEDVAMSIREFALEEGIAESLLDSVVDPTIVKFIDDYRRLKQGVSKGAAKRKAAPAKKIPAKKAKPAATKKKEKNDMVKARAFREDASKSDIDAFAKQLASRTLGNL